jgi:hypothetical protein
VVRRGSKSASAPVLGPAGTVAGIAHQAQCGPFIGVEVCGEHNEYFSNEISPSELSSWSPSPLDSQTGSRLGTCWDDELDVAIKVSYLAGTSKQRIEERDFDGGVEVIPDLGDVRSELHTYSDLEVPVRSCSTDGGSVLRPSSTAGIATTAKFDHITIPATWRYRNFGAVITTDPTIAITCSATCSPSRAVWAVDLAPASHLHGPTENCNMLLNRNFDSDTLPGLTVKHNIFRLGRWWGCRSGTGTCWFNATAPRALFPDKLLERGLDALKFRSASTDIRVVGACELAPGAAHGCYVAALRDAEYLPGGLATTHFSTPRVVLGYG